MSDTEGDNGAGKTGIGAEAVRREVWRSLVSLLRCYTNAAALNCGEFIVTEPDFNTVLLEHKGAKLKLHFNFVNGAADWRLSGKGHTESRGGFRMSEDGAFYIAGEEKQLDEAAIEWVEELAGSRARRQVS